MHDAKDQVITRARTLLDAVTYDSDGIMIGHQRQGGNGGLLSRDSLKAADQLRKALDALDSTPITKEVDGNKPS
ncbi:hypothetical protein [Devosia sp. 2618]|uniref:hypothetical protein n=1 Tax=Devosia sp. 2618 TaxID=3156454 RepID=UPI0033909A51